MNKFDQAIAADPENVDAYLYRRMLNLRHDHAAAARLDFDHVIATEADNDLALYFRAMAFKSTSDTSGTPPICPLIPGTIARNTMRPC